MPPLIAALLAILLLIVLIGWLKVHPFISIIISAFTLGILGGVPLLEIPKNFEKGFGEVLQSVGIITGLGAMLGGLLVSSGAADTLAERLIHFGGRKMIPVTTFFVALLIGLPLFFEVGFVMFLPLALTIARRTETPPFLVVLPMMAGLSIDHGLIPPHPGPTLIVSIFHAEIGLTILLALLVAIPSGFLAGPVFAVVMGRLSGLTMHRANAPVEPAGEKPEAGERPRASLPPALITVLLPPVLMMGRSIVDLLLPPENLLRQFCDFFGYSILALLIGVLYGIFALGLAQGWSLAKVQEELGRSLLPIGVVILVIGAGGGLKQMLIVAHVGDAIKNWASDAHFPPLALAWSTAALVRIATGSATVAAIAGGTLSAPIVHQTPGVSPELAVLATGAGSLVLSHVNDAGFWMVKEFLGISFLDTIKTWTVMETLLSIFGLIGVLVLSIFVH